MNLPLISHQHPNMFLNESMMANNNFQNFQTDNSSTLTNIELTNILTGAITEKSGNSKRQLKRKASDELWKNVKKKPGEDDSSSSDSTSRTTPISQETVSEIPTPTSALGFQSDLELSNLDPTELIGGSSEKLPSEFDNDDDLADVEDLLSTSKAKKHEKSPTMDLTDKNLVPPCVSITPISTSAGFSGGNSISRPGIEIIPITTSGTPPISNSITITPITSQKSEDRSREKKSSKSRSESDKSKLEKKRKRKREESPMGPPEKVPTKDPLTKPVSVSIKPAESPPSSTVRNCLV